MENSGIIVAFHTGRGGRFYNAGFKTYIGEKKIGEFTDDLFIRWTGEAKLMETIGDRENLLEAYEKAKEDNDFSFFEKLGFVMGEEEYYCGASGNSVGLTAKDVDSGIGSIDIDGAYNTTYTCDIEDCSEEEIELICKDSSYKNYDMKYYLKEEWQWVWEECNND